MQTRAEAAEKEVAQVKEKAWKMMEEKDAELRSAKVSATPSASLLDESLRRSVARHSQWPAIHLEPSVLQAFPRVYTRAYPLEQLA